MRSQPDNSLLEVVAALEWGKRSEFTEDALPSRYRAHVKALFKDFVKNGQSRNIRGIDALVEIIGGLSEAVVDQVLGSPVVSAVLRELQNQKYPDHFLEIAVEAFEEWLLIEAGRKTGDSVCAGFRVKQSGEREPSPHLDGRVPIDFDFPHEWQHLDVGVSRMAYISEVDRPTIVRKLEDGFGLLKRISPLAADFTLNHTNVILVRAAPEEKHSSSSSNLLRNGATMLRNIHFESCTVDIIADFLLHEAIHHCLYRFEIVEKPFVCALTGERQPFRAVKSPWSGHRISSDSFLQACFVWFGLWRFWSLAASTLGSGAPWRELCERQRLCAFGFIRHQKLSEITIPSAFLPPAFLCEAIDQMQAVVCEGELK